MKKTVLFLAAIAVLLFSSCEKDGLTYTERLIVGNWEYSKVKYLEDWSVNSDDLSQDYAKFEIEFNPDFSARYYDTETGRSSTGLWELSQVSSGDECSNVIYASFTDDETSELSQVVFEDASILRNTIRACYRVADGRFRYVLRSLD